MNYLSTRGLAPQLRFSEILLGGLASDGGLYVPETYPRFSEAELAAMRGMNYRELAFTVLSRLIDDIPADDLKRIIDKTYTAQTYRYVTDRENPEDITPLKTLEPGLHVIHQIQGIGDGFIPSVLDPGLIDDVITVSDDDAVYCTRKLSRTLGLLVGTSAGANVYAARILSARLGPGSRVATVLPDRAERYFSTALL